MAGAELYTYEVSKYLVKKGYEVDVITKHFGNLKSFEIIDGIRVHRVRSLDIPKMRSLFAMPSSLLKALKMEYDLIHAHITYPSALIAYVLSKVKKVPYLVTCQGDELLDYPESRELRYIKPALSVALRNAGRIHSISQAIKKSLVSNFGVHPDIIEVIPNGVDLSKFRPDIGKDLRREFKTDFVLINVSRLSPKNNVDSTIKAARIVKDSGRDFKYLIVGDGEEQDRLRRLVKKLGLKSTVVFTGWIQHRALPRYIAGSDAFIRASVTEGLGIVFLEAMACGTPVIASRVQGILDIVEHGRTGLLVDPEDVEDIADGIAKLIENRRLRERLRNNGLKFVKKFDWKNICERTERLYFDIEKK